MIVGVSGAFLNAPSSPDQIAAPFKLSGPRARAGWLTPRAALSWITKRSQRWRGLMMLGDVLNLSIPALGTVSIGATAQDGMVRVIATATLGNGRAQVEPELARRFAKTLIDAADAADAQRLATQTGP